MPENKWSFRQCFLSPGISSLPQFDAAQRTKSSPIHTAALNMSQSRSLQITSLILQGKPVCKQQHINKDWKKTMDLKLKKRNLRIINNWVHWGAKCRFCVQMFHGFWILNLSLIAFLCQPSWMHQYQRLGQGEPAFEMNFWDFYCVRKHSEMATCSWFLSDACLL